LREALTAKGRVFESETDTEVVAHLVSDLVEGGLSPVDAVKALPQLRGAFALAIAFREHPDMLIGARLGSPLVVGYGEGETYLGSDALALAPLTQRICYLEEGDWVVIRREGVQMTRTTIPSTRPIVASGASGGGGKGQFPPLHAEGNLRAAHRGGPDAAKLCASVDESVACRRSISTCRPSAA
jgi:glucosamine--fructose-6-phosphate aminotransferase (isomerizing)